MSDAPGTPALPEPAPVGEVPEVTGHPAVDAALARLDAVADRVPAEQVSAYEAVHRQLTGTLAGIDSA